MRDPREKFDGVKNYKLRAYNRATLLLNLLKDFGPLTAEEYAAQFSGTERQMMFLILYSIKDIGQEATLKVVREGVEYEGYDEEGMAA